MGWAVLFDLDGTLVDTLDDIACAMEEVLRELGLPSHPKESYRQMVGNGARELVRRALPTNAHHLLEKGLAMFKARYRQVLTVHSRPYPGILPLLSELHARGVRLGVLTNKPHEAAVAILNALFPPHLFQAIQGHIDGLPPKPHPQGALCLLQELKASTERACIVGDSPIDVHTAKHAGTRAIGVSWGFRPRSELEEAGADCIASKPSDVLVLLHAMGFPLS
ncbi:MAG: HAD family hydrolase [Sandaracinaceae bacterium]|nr:HAD family hydrolase [Sandaracinaceae bacterium]